MTSHHDEIDRLQNRLDRERRARRQAEIIAERGMRELWQANDELQRRVTTRTAELLTALGALEYEQVARSAAIARALDTVADHLSSSCAEAVADARSSLASVRSLLATAPEPTTSTVSIEGDLGSFADGLLARWQRLAAGAGQLLSVGISDDAGSDGVDWSVLRAVSDNVLRWCVRNETTGGLRVTLSLTHEGASVAFSAGGPALAAELVEAALASPAAWPAVGPGCEHLAVAQAIVESAGGSMRIECGEVKTSVSVVVPLAPVGSMDPADPV